MENDGLTSPAWQQQQPPHCLYTKMSLLPTLNVPNAAIPTPGTNAWPTVKSATIAATCTHSQPCTEKTRDLIAQSMMTEPNLPGTTEPGHPKVTWPIPRTVLTANLGSTAGAGRATLLEEVGTPTVATAEAHQPSIPTNHPVISLKRQVQLNSLQTRQHWAHPSSLTV